MIVWINKSRMWIRRNIFYILDVLKFSGIIILMVVSINLYTKAAEQARETKKVVESQNMVLEAQSEILLAIERLAKDNKLTSEEKTNTIICMLQIEVEERTPNILKDCREKAIEAKQNNSLPISSSPKALALLRA